MFLVLTLLLATLLSSCVGYVDQYGRPIPPHVAMRAMQCAPQGGVRSVVPYQPYQCNDGYILQRGVSPTGNVFYRDPSGRGWQDLSDGGPNRTGRLIYVYY